mmetsp:Transcript_91499/g.261445  ORF Transcript_91499/g.261445 Transcript_91499/m.261445 type:complete len:577 (-) Transcript_91499:578-2308(-)
MAKGLGVELVDLLGGTDGSTLELLRDDKKPSVGDIFAFAAPPSATTADDDHPPSPGPSVDAIGVADAFVGAMLEDTVRRVAKLALMITATTSRADGWAAASALEGRADADADADADSSVAPKGEVWTEENQASVEVARLDEDSGNLSIAELFAPLHEGEAIAPAKPNMPAATTLPVAKDVAEVVVPPLRLATAEEVLAELGQASLEEGLLSHDAGVEGEAAASDRPESKVKQPRLAVLVGVAHAFMFSVAWLWTKGLLETLNTALASSDASFAAAATLITARGVVGSVFCLFQIKRSGGEFPSDYMGPPSTALRLLLLVHSVTFLATIAAFYVAMSGLRLGDGSAIWLSRYTALEELSARAATRSAKFPCGVHLEITQPHREVNPFCTSAPVNKLYYNSPILSMVIGVMVFGEPFTLGARLAALLAVPGVLCVVQPEGVFGSRAAVAVATSSLANITATAAPADAHESHSLSMAVMACAAALKAIGFALTQAIGGKLSKNTLMLGFFLANFLGGVAYLTASGTFAGALHGADLLTYLGLASLSVLAIAMQFVMIFAIELDSASKFDLTQVKVQGGG